MFFHVKPLTSLAGLLTLLITSLFISPAFALEFKTVAVPKAVLYDAPSAAAKKVRLLSQYYPVEVIVNLGDWLKVRDARGGISWIEAKHLSAKRMVMVTANNAELRQSADAASPVLATLEKDVALEVAEDNLSNGWLKVKHRDGLTGFILISSTWGFN
jgi:SH3-like domain-containing protein